MNKDLIKKGYDEIAGKYVAQRDLFKSRGYLERFNKLLKPNSTILDLGCGGGKPVDEFFVHHGHKVIGIDISDKMIEIAKRSVPEAAYEVKDMADMKDGEYNVDTVVSFYAIFHTDRERHSQIFKTINSFLPVGGFILVTMGNSDWEGAEADFWRV